MTTLLDVRDLRVSYRRDGEEVPVVRGIDLRLDAGESLGLAGESGCGKSTAALALMNLLPAGARCGAAGWFFDGRPVAGLGAEGWRRLRGEGVGIVFQDPFTALNPVLTVGDQIDEIFRCHRGRADRAASLDLLARVRLEDPARIHGSYPHQLSGGQRQRVCLAMAVALRPRLLVADEPTTALDVSVQRGILDLLDELRREAGMALLFITHNLGLLAERTDRLAVMYAGRVVETGVTAEVLAAPRHPYTQGLLACVPRLSGPAQGRLPAMEGSPPDPRRRPSGCPFHPRCPRRFEPCAGEEPLLSSESHASACHLHVAER